MPSWPVKSCKTKKKIKQLPKRPGKSCCSKVKPNKTNTKSKFTSPSHPDRPFLVHSFALSLTSFPPPDAKPHCRSSSLEPSGATPRSDAQAQPQVPRAMPGKIREVNTPTAVPVMGILIPYHGLGNALNIGVRMSLIIPNLN